MLGRITAFCYGIACYLLFLACFVYAIGFLGNFGVPESHRVTAFDGRGHSPSPRSFDPWSCPHALLKSEDFGQCEFDPERHSERRLRP
jgi:hypothetical protein